MLHNLGNYTDGCYSVAGLVLDADGNLHGTTPKRAARTTAWDGSS